MDIQLRKLTFMEEFLRINNEKIISRLEKLLNDEKKKLYKKELTPFTIEEFEKTIDQSEKELKQKKYKSSAILKQEVKQWK